MLPCVIPLSHTTSFADFAWQVPSVIDILPIIPAVLATPASKSAVLAHCAPVNATQVFLLATLPFIMFTPFTPKSIIPVEASVQPPVAMSVHKPSVADFLPNVLVSVIAVFTFVPSLFAHAVKLAGKQVYTDVEVANN